MPVRKYFIQFYEAQENNALNDSVPYGPRHLLDLDNQSGDIQEHTRPDDGQLLAYLPDVGLQVDFCLDADPAVLPSAQSLEQYSEAICWLVEFMFRILYH